MYLYCPTFTDFVFLDNSFPLRCTLTVSIPNKVDSANETTDKLVKLICNLKENTFAHHVLSCLVFFLKPSSLSKCKSIYQSFPLFFPSTRQFPNAASNFPLYFVSETQTVYVICHQRLCPLPGRRRSFICIWPPQRHRVGKIGSLRNQTIFSPKQG